MASLKSPPRCLNWIISFPPYSNMDALCSLFIDCLLRPVVSMSDFFSRGHIPAAAFSNQSSWRQDSTIGRRDVLIDLASRGPTSQTKSIAPIPESRNKSSSLSFRGDGPTGESWLFARPINQPSGTLSGWFFDEYLLIYLSLASWLAGWLAGWTKLSKNWI